jgi:fermentation-respiration switch protein FrsA (DUF1100 family)
MAKTASGPRPWIRRLIAVLLVVCGLATFLYVGLSTYIATQLVYVPQKPLKDSPAHYAIAYKDVTFPSHEDHIQLKGWFIPGRLPNGQLTTQRTIVVVHGARQNRADPSAGVLDISLGLVFNGFAVLSFDMRGMGQSPPAPFSLGYFEQRDVLGAVDFLRTGPLPYPDLGRPKAIGGWGVSMGAATLLMASAQEPAIQAVVADCPYADIIPILEREIPKGGGLPPLFTPGALLAAQAVYGMNFYADRPVDVVAKIAPRPLFLIHGSADTYIPPVNQDELYAAATAPPNAHVQEWRVAGAEHAQSFHTMPSEYMQKIVAFFTAALGPAA